MPPAKPRQISRWPLLGFVSALPRQLIPFGAMGPGSKNWLVGNQRQLRVPGGDTVTNGLLESTWGAVAKRVYAAALRSVTNGFSVPLVLFMNEAAHYATLCFRSTNGGGSWRTVGQEFSTFHYPDDTAPNHRVMPMVYENQYGGLTVHRLNTAEHRARWANGSRSIHFSGGQAIIPSIPARWNMRFNDATNAGSEPCEVFPLGLVPPLAVPELQASEDVGASTHGAWNGADGFFYAIAAENDRGELSWMTVARPLNSAWSGYEGFGWFQVSPSNPTHNFKAVLWTGIQKCAPDIRWLWLIRSTKVAMSSSTVSFPPLNTMSLVARVPNGTTTYTDTAGDDASLSPDRRISEQFDVAHGLQWPAPGRHIGRCDGHLLLGNLLPPRYALLAAPWDSGAQNYAFDDTAAWADPVYAIAVTPSEIVFRKVVAGVETDAPFGTTALSLRELVDRVNADASYADTTFTNCHYVTGALVIVTDTGVFTGVAAGDEVVSPAFPTGTKVVRFIGSGVTATVLVDQVCGATASGQSVTFRRRTGGTDRPWVMGVVPGADADASCDDLLRTRVATTADYTSGDLTLDVDAADAPYVTPGMLLYGSDWPANTTITAVSGATLTVDKPCTGTGAGASVVCAYDTGDSTAALDPGFIRTPAPCFPAPIFWNKAHLDADGAFPNDIQFSCASPGYPQDGINTWMRANRPSGPDVFGHHMAFADMGALAMVWFAKARMRLWNQRTGQTHEDEDYWLTTSSWARGCRCPFAVVSGNGWAVFLSDEGFFGVGVQTALSQYGDLTFASESPEKLISKALYDAERPEGERGELEHSILRCIASSDSGGSDYPITANVDGGVLYVNYERDDGSRWQIRYDFSMGNGRTGLAEILQDDGEPYAWSAPLEFAVEACAKVPQSDGKVHLYAAIAGNTGATDGRVDELGSSDDYNGAPVVADDFSGLAFSGSLDLVQPTDIRATLMRRAATGVTVGIMQNPQLEPTDPGAIFVPFPVGNDNMDAFGRSVVQTDTEAARGVPAVAIHVRDDGSGPPSEITQLRISVTETASVTTERDP